MPLEAAVNVTTFIQSVAIVTCEHLVRMLVSLWRDKIFQLCVHKV